MIHLMVVGWETARVFDWCLELINTSKFRVPLLSVLLGSCLHLLLIWAPFCLQLFLQQKNSAEVLDQVIEFSIRVKFSFFVFTESWCVCLVHSPSGKLGFCSICLNVTSLQICTGCVQHVELDFLWTYEVLLIWAPLRPKYQRKRIRPSSTLFFWNKEEADLPTATVQLRQML